MSLKAMREAIAAKKTEKPKPPPPKPKPVAPVKAEKPPAKPPNKKERRKAKVKEEAILGRYPDGTVLKQTWDAAKGVYLGEMTIRIPTEDGTAFRNFTRTHPALHQLLREFWRKDFVPWAKANGIPIVQQLPVKPAAESPLPAVPPPTE